MACIATDPVRLEVAKCPGIKGSPQLEAVGVGSPGPAYVRPVAALARGGGAQACPPGSRSLRTGDRLRAASRCATAGAVAHRAVKTETAQSPAVSVRSAMLQGSAASDDTATRPGTAAFRPPPGLSPPTTCDDRVSQSRPSLVTGLAPPALQDSARSARGKKGTSKQMSMPPGLFRAASPSSTSGCDTATPGSVSDLETCSSVSADSHDEAVDETSAQTRMTDGGRPTHRPKQQGPPGTFTSKAGVARPPGFFRVPPTSRA